MKVNELRNLELGDGLLSRLSTHETYANKCQWYNGFNYNGTWIRILI